MEESEKIDYNSIPVVYCKECLSLKIRILDENLDHCDECGSTETEQTDIQSWLKMYKNRYGKNF